MNLFGMYAMTPWKCYALLLSVAGLAFAASDRACASDHDTAHPDFQQTGPGCTIASFRSLPEVRIISAEKEAEPVPHCKLLGVIGHQTHFELLLPDHWNGKFVMGGGGGFVGSVVNAAQGWFGALQKGYATAGTDTGHQAHSLDASWALNNLERLVNFGHQAVHRTAVNSKALIEDYYDREIGRSYFAGCSRGGGQALMEAQRYPEDFDGIVAMSPAYNWTHELGARWIRIAQLMYPDPTRIEKPVIGSEALNLIGTAVMAQCDDLDGLSDGILNDPRHCDFDLSSLSCSEAKTSKCLSEQQLAAAEAIYGDFEAGDDLDYHEGTDSGEFMAPPAPNGTWAFSTGIFRYFLYNDPTWNYAGYDFSDFAQKAARVAHTLNADNPDLSDFRSRGGKLILDNGWMDGSMSAYGTIKYYERVLEFDPTAAEDVRLFIRPGVTHCNVGPGPDGTDYLDAIDDWVESGKAPEKLPASYRSPVGKVTGGGRILCAWPSVVRYRGDGDPKDPASFFCSKHE
jgi:feruloyl esterase